MFKTINDSDDNCVIQFMHDYIGNIKLLQLPCNNYIFSLEAKICMTLG